MRKISKLLVVLVIAMAGTACGGVAPVGPVGLSSADKVLINAALDKWESAFLNEDATGLASIFAPEITIVNVAGSQVTSPSEMEDVLRESFQYTIIHDAAFYNRHISGAGANAIVTAVWYIHSTILGHEGESATEMEWRFAKLSGAWKVDRIETKQ